MKTLTRDYGSSLTHRTTYRYGGAKGDVAGRGFLGFRWMEAKDARTGILTSTEYRQAHPYIGQVSANSRFLANGTALGGEENTWSARSLNAGKTKFPYISRSVGDTYELEDGPDNARIARVTTTSTYDAYGNPTAMTVTTVGAGGTFTKRTTNTYTNNVSRWHLGRLTCAKVRSTAPGQSTLTRTSGFAYHATTGLLTKAVIEPGSGDVTGCVSAGAGDAITHITEHIHDQYGNRKSETVSGAGITARTTTTVWGERASDGTVSANGRYPVQKTNALGHVEKLWYGAAHGGVVKHEGPNGLVTLWTYDGFGRVVREVRADGTETTTAYQSCSQTGSGCPSRAVLAVRTQTTGAPATVRYLDRRGLEVRSETEGFDGTAIYRDAEHDALGRMVKVTDALGGSTTYAYDALGHLLTNTDASGNETTLGYDLRGRKTSMSDPDMGAWSYTYNTLGELLSQSDAKGQTVTMLYDKLGRMTRRTEAEGTTTWSYDTATKGKGKLHQVSGPSGYLRVHAYDAYARPKSETTTITMETFTTSRTYDAAGRVATLTYPETDFSVGQSYTSTGYLRTLYDVETPETVYWRAEALSAEGQLTEVRYGNGVGTTRTYDPETGFVTSIQSGLGDTSDVQDLGYAFDSLANLTTREDFLEEVYESFTYDNLNRLTGATVYGAVDDAERVTKSYAYDAIGNIVNKSDVSAADYVYGTGNAAGAGDAGPHAVVSAGGDTYAYDDNGNMLSGAGRTLTWTSDNKPRTIATTTTSTTFVYGPDRARIEQRKVQGATTTTIKYVGAVFEQVTTTGEATEYVHYLFAGGERVAIHTEDDAPTPSETLRYLHTDHLGSVDTITDDAGAVVERLSYDAWGKRRTASGTDVWEDPALPIAAEETRRGFTDHEHLDDFALVHMNARVYDPKLGRFLSPDPFIQFPESTQGFNRYTYTLNNPLSFTDPTGYFLSRSFAEGLEGSIGGGATMVMERIRRVRLTQPPRPIHPKRSLPPPNPKMMPRPCLPPHVPTRISMNMTNNAICWTKRSPDSVKSKNFANWKRRPLSVGVVLQSTT